MRRNSTLLSSDPVRIKLSLPKVVGDNVELTMQNSRFVEDSITGTGNTTTRIGSPARSTEKMEERALDEEEARNTL